MAARAPTLWILLALTALLLSAQRGELEPLTPVSAAAGVVPIRSLPALITRPGRYLLAASLTGPEHPPASAQHGIVVRADDVEIDLGGWALIGGAGSGTGILVQPPDKRERVRGLVVRNGTVRNWGAFGIEAGSVEMLRLEDLHVAHNGTRGEPQAGANLGVGALVEGCSFHRNSGHGLVAGRGAVITRCVASHNGSDGFRLVDVGLLRDSTSFDNGGDGVELQGVGGLLSQSATAFNAGSGVVAAAGALVRGATSVHNGHDGVSPGGSGMLVDSLCRGNAGAGVTALGTHDLGRGNHLVANSTGLFLGGRSGIAQDNVLAGNGTPATVFPRNPWTHVTRQPSTTAGKADDADPDGEELVLARARANLVSH